MKYIFGGELWENEGMSTVKKYSADGEVASAPGFGGDLAGGLAQPAWISPDLTEANEGRKGVEERKLLPLLPSLPSVEESACRWRQFEATPR